MQEYKILLNGKKLFYRTIGSGPAVVLLHGFGEDGTVWVHQYDALEGYSLIIPDLPGSGGSEMTTDMSMEGMAASVKSLLDELQITKSALIGHSMGGYVTLAFAEKYPEYLNGFGLFHSTAYADSEEKKETRRKGIDFIRRHGALEFLKASIPNLFSPISREKNPSVVEEQIRSAHNFSGAALVSYYESMIQRPNRIDILKKSKVPVLFILGRHDAAVPLKDGLEQCYLPDLAYIHILENAGHMGMKEEKEQANTILLNYLNSLDHQTR